jgi:hypothetical protein
MEYKCQAIEDHRQTDLLIVHPMRQVCLGVLVGESGHPVPCSSACVLPVLGSQFERQVHTLCSKCNLWGAEAILLPSFFASWFLSRIQSGAELDASEMRTFTTSIFSGVQGHSVTVLPVMKRVWHAPPVYQACGPLSGAAKHPAGV